MIRIKKRFLFLLLFCFWHTALFAQNPFAQNPNGAIDSLLIVLKTAKEDTSKLKTLNILSRLYIDTRNYDEGMKYANDAIALANNILNAEGKEVTAINKAAKKGTGNAHRNLGLISFYKGDFLSAVKIQQAALKFSEEIGEKGLTANIYFDLGNTHGFLEEGNNDEAVRYFLEALKVYEEIGDKPGASLLHFSLGNFYTNNFKYAKALKSYQASLKIRTEIGDKRGMASCYVNLASIYWYQGVFTEALKNGLAGVKIGEELGNKMIIAGANSIIGIINTDEKNYEGALKHLTISLNIYKELGRKDDIGKTYINIGMVYTEQKNFTEGLKNSNEALKIFQEIKSDYYIEKCLINIGLCYLRTENFAEAIKNFQASLKLSEKWKHKGSFIEAGINMGFSLSLQASSENKPPTDQKFKEALQYLDKAMLVAKEIGDKENLKLAYNGFSHTYKAMNNYKKALEFSNLYVEMKDSLMNTETTRKLEQQRTQYEVEKAVAGEKLQQEKELTEQKFLSEKALTEKNAKFQLELAEEKVKKEKAIEIEKLKYKFTLAEERTVQEKILAEEKFENEKNLTEENARHQLALTEQKALQDKKDAAEKVKQEKKEATLIAQQEKQKSEQKRKTDLLMLGAGMLIVILVLVFLYMRQITLKQKAEERADAVHKMAELELQSLRAQLNPHFMFNSLNAIQDLILKEDIRSSHRYLSRFSKLLRMLLDNANQPFISLKKELDFLELYLSLEKLRIPDLQYTIETEPGIDTETTLVPNMTLQPYIENAIWHGLSHKTSDKKLGVNIHRENGSIQCDIEDNGVGRKKAEELKSLYRKEHKSKGMELLSKRFTLLSKEYGTEIQTRVTDLMNNGHAAGTLVEINVPLAFSKKAILYDTNHYN